MKLYAGDGTTLTLAATGTSAKTSFVNTRDLLIGNLPSTSTPNREFNGLIDNFRVYNEVLNSAQLAEVMRFDDSIPEPTATLLMVLGSGLAWHRRK